MERLTKHLHTFLRKVVTTDETWTYHYIPETIEQSKQWKPAPTSEEEKSVASVGKVIAQIFWDFKGIVMIDYLPKGQTITGEYYVNQLQQSQETILKNRPRIAMKVLFHHYDGPLTQLQSRWPKFTGTSASTVTPYPNFIGLGSIGHFPVQKAQNSFWPGGIFSMSIEILAATESF